MAEYTPEEVEAAKEKARKIAEETRAKSEAERPRTYTERLQDMGRLPKGGGGSGTGAETGFGIQKLNKNLNRSYKSGGKISSASKRADGIAIKGKTKGRMV